MVGKQRCTHTLLLLWWLTRLAVAAHTPCSSWLQRHTLATPGLSTWAVACTRRERLEATRGAASDGLATFAWLAVEVCRRCMFAIILLCCV